MSLIIMVITVVLRSMNYTKKNDNLIGTLHITSLLCSLQSQIFSCKYLHHYLPLFDLIEEVHLQFEIR